MINDSGYCLRFILEVNFYGYMLWLWIKFWNAIKFYGRGWMLIYMVKVYIYKIIVNV
jgi:hypothetical protein